MRILALLLSIASCAGSAAPRGPAAPRVLAAIDASTDLDGVVVGASNDLPTVAIVFASWCGHCRAELRELDALRSERVRILGINYKGHEDYGNRGGPAAIRAFAHDTAPWLRIVPVGEEVFGELGRPPVIPTVLVFDRRGTLIATYDPREHTPTRSELSAVISKL